MNPRPGTILGQYRILALAGSGGMGHVFKAEHTLTKRIEAIKILATRNDTSPEQIARFLREIEVHANLRHPNIVPVYSAFQADDTVGMSMEYVEGHSLEALLQRNAVPIGHALDYTCQVLCALGHAHRSGIVHRDISPGNMIVTDEGRVMLTDFGLAKPLNDKRVTQGVTAIGSILYMPPEQVRALPAIDGRADIYATGAVLYEMVTGRPPFNAESVFSVMLAHVDEPPVPPAELNPDLPAGLNEIILKALNKAAADRYQSAEEFLMALIPIRDAICGSAFAEPNVLVPVASSAPVVRAPMIRAAGQAMVWVCAAALAIAAGLQIHRGVLAPPGRTELATIQTALIRYQISPPVPPLKDDGTPRVLISPKPEPSAVPDEPDAEAFATPAGAMQAPEAKRPARRLEIAARIPPPKVAESSKPVYITIPPILPPSLTSASGPVPTPPSLAAPVTAATVKARVPEEKKKHPFLRALGIFVPDKKKKPEDEADSK
jgi:serine/threonine-protein kinase